MKKMTRLSLLIDGMVIFQGLKVDPVVTAFKSLLEKAGAQELDFKEVYREYHRFTSLATEVHWPGYLWNRIIQDKNEFSRQAQGGKKEVSKQLRELAGRDLLWCREITSLTSEEIKKGINQRLAEEMKEHEGLWREVPFAPSSWPNWLSTGQGPLNELPSGEESFGQEKDFAQSYLLATQARLKDILEQGSAEEMVNALLSYYQEMGTGLFCQGLAFKWRSNSARLEAVAPDPIRKNQLINQEREQGIVLENTEFFIKGYSANNIILYGNRGTGKSSLVKALLHEYCARGLRLVELSKTDLQDYPKIIALLANQPLKFIIFIDDLSFEDTEADYKHLKTLLEGGLEGKPKNVLIYATSNRRNLVRETFAERQGDEVHRRDNMEEKLSLSDRFGITVTFPTPDQEGYLKIVAELANQEGLQVPRDHLRQQALRWVMNHNARSGRTARQFVDYLLAKQGTTLEDPQH